MPQRAKASIIEHFGVVEDPRLARHKQQKLLDIIGVAICAVSCGAEGWVAVAAFGRANSKGLKRFLEFPPGLPSHDTVGRVFSLISPTHFPECFRSWRQAVAEGWEGQGVAIDGKTLRRSYDRGSDKAAIHMIRAWASKNRVGWGQLKTAEKSHELRAIPELLKVVEGKGGIVTLEARGCQKALATQLVEQQGD